MTCQIGHKDRNLPIGGEHSRQDNWKSSHQHIEQREECQDCSLCLLALEVLWVRVELRGWWMPLGAKIAQVTISIIALIVNKQQRMGVK